MSNALEKEKSPYLLQHAENPVEWVPWTEEAFQKAAVEEKPVFLSIGYATCHWCHVMAHESFEDLEVAGLMNRAFINVKVDREERPDIDHTFMTICQLLTGQGGWPLTVVMTPDKRPFFAATYIPRETRFNRIGMLELIPKIEAAWSEEREKVIRSAERIARGYTQTLQLPKAERPDSDRVEEAFDALSERFDPENGGFGSRPKFPSPHNILFLLQYSQSFHDTRALDMARHTLEKMRLGGIFDQIGFGFHRYATDAAWQIPHFEKMLCDQALLLLTYAEGWKHTGDPLLRQTVLEILSYLQEQLQAPEGGFYSAEDADSEGEEGKFYVWRVEEVRARLNEEEANFTIEQFSLEEKGNFTEETTGQRTGANIPRLSGRPGYLNELQQGEGGSHVHQKFEKVRAKLKTARDRRVRPLLDDKILTDWNGLTIAALARSGALLDHKPSLRGAESAWKFIHKTMIRNDGTLLHRYREGDAAIDGMADDYAFLIWGLIELHQATLNLTYLQDALKLNNRFLMEFRDEIEGGFYFSREGSKTPLGRHKQIHDGAIPSSNSVAALNLIRLSRLTGRTKLEEHADELFDSFSGLLKQAPGSATFALLAVTAAVKPAAEIVICGERGNPITEQMIRIVHRDAKLPCVLLLKTPENAQQLEESAPYTSAFPASSDGTAWVCHQFHCEAPVSSPGELKELLTPG